MNINILDIYYIKKTDEIFNYIKIIFDELGIKEKTTEIDVKNIINEYITDNVKERLKISYSSEKFMNNYGVFHYKLKNITNYVIEYSKKIKKEHLEKKSEYIMLLSELILFATELDIKTNIFLNEKLKYGVVVKDVLEENLKVIDEKYIEIISKKNKEITNCLKVSVKNQRVFFKKLEDNNFKILYEHYITSKNTEIYDVILSVSNKRLGKFKSSIVIEQLNSKKNFENIIYTKIFNIHKLIIRLQYFKNKDVMFFIEIPEECKLKEKDFNKILNLLSGYKISKHIILKTSYKNFEENYKIYTNNKVVQIAVSNVDKYKKTILKDVNYIIIDKYNEKRESEILFAKENKIKIIDNEYVKKSKDLITEEELLNHFSNK